MDDYFDDFDDDSGDDFGDDSGDDFGSGDSLDDDGGIEEEPTGEDVCDDEFTVEDAVMAGVAFGWGYEEGMEEVERRKLERKMNADRKNRDREDDI